jgi:hypothetical protein
MGGAVNVCMPVLAAAVTVKLLAMVYEPKGPVALNIKKVSD